ncbi:hypothetical protein PVAND_007058 [Polypedilum vanderplanki]|uniref:Cytoplasmic tRNA 2-thiolation protein 2 n=1 Tax=Polypedilum vanderplanki TaxID=319348 RepID=A0A9J6C586_POLVA|nr:hypothetical protein PVAND_007058 [Polypedilum vanderplanki]
MCSIGEEDFGDEGGAHAMIEDIKSLEIVDEICKKCSNEKSVINIIYAMCKTCFLHYVTHKFRASLSASKIVPSNSKVLLNFSGYAPDVCILDMIDKGLLLEYHKKLRFELEIIYIDEDCLNEGNDINDLKRRYERIDKVKKILEQFVKFKCHYSSIANKYIVLPLDDIKENDMNAVINDEIKLLAYLKSLKSSTCKQDYVDIIRNENLRHIANQLNCQFVFLTDTTIDLAKRFISNMALGRGSSVAFDVSFCDDRVKSIRFLRPIKNVNMIEVESYIKLKDLDVIGAQKEISNTNQLSIQNVTSQFIDGLQQNFSSTVSTVARGCSKIAPYKKSNQSNHVNGEISSKLNQTSASVTDINQRCYLCKSFLDYQNSETLYAIEFSRFVSEAAADIEHILKNTEKIEEKAMSEVNSNENEFKKHLCHGCRNIFIGSSDDILAEIFQ